MRDDDCIAADTIIQSRAAQNSRERFLARHAAGSARRVLSANQGRIKEELETRRLKNATSTLERGWAGVS